jgi:hypothetical protein
MDIRTLCLMTDFLPPTPLGIPGGGGTMDWRKEGGGPRGAPRGAPGGGGTTVPRLPFGGGGIEGGLTEIEEARLLPGGGGGGAMLYRDELEE